MATRGALLIAVLIAAPVVADEWKGLEGQKTWVTSLDYSADGKLLATGGGQTLLYRPGSVDVWASTRWRFA